jgi:hypothetical protein
LTEDEFLAWVVRRCEDAELYWFHSFDSRRDKMTGWPDLVIVGHGILFRELKSAQGAVSAAQSSAGRAIMAGGGNWDVWRPADIEAGRIQRELRQLAVCPRDRDEPVIRPGLAETPEYAPVYVLPVAKPACFCGRDNCEYAPA